LAEFSTAGINRLSIGVQSLDDKLLKTLGRRHDAIEAEEAVTRALAAGFENLSIDLMYGLPDQKLQQWIGTLDRALSLGCHHMSMYALTLEPGTPMQKAETSGHLNTPDPDLAADMYLATEARMNSQGYRHYEISNWCLPGHESKHNLTYWRNHPFLGVGPGAHSYIDGVRFSVQRSPREYTLGLSTDPSMPEGESWSDTLREISFVDMVKGIPPSDEMAETMMMGLRLDVGVNNRHFTARFGISLEDAYGPVIFGAQNDGLLRWTYPYRLEAEATGANHSDASLQLTAKGRLLGNEIFSRFFT
jgi:oxygen-independent coproporphyrinogen-3 oxidase